MEKNTQVKCPSCGSEIDVQDILAHQLEDEIKIKYQAQLQEQLKRKEIEYKEQQNAINQRLEGLDKEKAEFEAKKKQANEMFQDRLEASVKAERKLIEEKLKLKMEEESSERLKALNTELAEKSEQVKELYRSQAEVEKLKREKGELKEAAEAEAQKQLNAQLQSEREKIKKSEEEKNELRFKEMQKQLEDQKKLTAEMQRKQEQGSMQLQGEVQELAIEDWLARQFPLDSIEEIKKGARGGDCIQTVNTYEEQNCGTIYYESKRTKDFQPSWIEKFKADIRTRGADVGVLVTEVMPKDMKRMTFHEGIWICDYNEFKGLCAVLRQTVIQVNGAVLKQENKGDKMHMLYDFLTGSTFRMQVEAIVEGFTQMKTDLDKEKRAMQKIWKQREKQIDKVVDNTIDMYGSIKGIAGNAVQSVKALEMPFDDDNLLED